MNYYHLDSIVVMSLLLLCCCFLRSYTAWGQSAIFLIGGESRPTPILLRSGDVVIMSSEARLAYHGVPRILGPSLDGGGVPASLSAEAIAAHCWCVCGGKKDKGGCHGAEGWCCIPRQRLASTWPNFVSYLSVSRINILSHVDINTRHRQTLCLICLCLVLISTCDRSFLKDAVFEVKG